MDICTLMKVQKSAILRKLLILFIYISLNFICSGGENMFSGFTKNPFLTFLCPGASCSRHTHMYVEHMKNRKINTVSSTLRCNYLTTFVANIHNLTHVTVLIYFTPKWVFNCHEKGGCGWTKIIFSFVMRLHQQKQYHKALMTKTSVFRWDHS